MGVAQEVRRGSHVLDSLLLFIASCIFLVALDLIVIVYTLGSYVMTVFTFAFVVAGQTSLVALAVVLLAF